MRNFILLACLLFASSVYSQNINPNFCNADPSKPADDGLPGGTPLPYLNPSQNFQMVVEKNADGMTEETEEFYDGVNNVGVATQYLAGVKLSTYYNYSINELLIVKGYQCRALKLNESYEEGPFFYVLDDKGQEHIVSAFGLLLISQLKVQYLGSVNRRVRGISVKEWQTCFYSNQKKATVRVTMSFTYNWAPAVPVPDQPNIPVQVLVEYDTQPATSATHVVTQFRPGLLIRDEYTRVGVYCADKANFHENPSVPKRFSFLAHLAQSKPDSDSTNGELSVLDVSADFDKKLFRMDYGISGQVITEIHDQHTNLRYKINQMAKNCSVTVLDPNSPFEPHSASQFFNFDAKPELQFVGQRKIRGINTDVWVAPRKYMGRDTIWSWHFMATGWAVQETFDVMFNEPVAIVIDEINANYTGIKQQTTFLISAFDETRHDMYDFDISYCEDKLDQQHFRFKITNDPNYEVMKYNEAEFRDGVISSIHHWTNLHLIRINRLHAYFQNKTVYVSFTLFEKSRLNGNPAEAADEPSLSDVVKKLTDGINKGDFNIIYHLHPDKYTIKNFTTNADKGSLENLDNRDGRYIYTYYNQGKINGYGDGSLAGFIIGFTIIGIVLGLVAGVFLILKKSSPLPIPGFLNPNFKAKETA